MSETSFKIKCSKSASARRFSLSKPTLADLRSHVEASWGASGPSFWYVDDDGDRISVETDHELDAAIAAMRGTCASLNVDFSSGSSFDASNGALASPVSISHQPSDDEDGFITVELHSESETGNPAAPLLMSNGDDLPSLTDTQASVEQIFAQSDDGVSVQPQAQEFLEQKADPEPSEQSVPSAPLRLPRVKIFDSLSGQSNSVLTILQLNQEIETLRGALDSARAQAVRDAESARQIQRCIIEGAQERFDAATSVLKMQLRQAEAALAAAERNQFVASDSAKLTKQHPAPCDVQKLAEMVAESLELRTLNEDLRSCLEADTKQLKETLSLQEQLHGENEALHQKLELAQHEVMQMRGRVQLAEADVARAAAERTQLQAEVEKWKQETANVARAGQDAAAASASLKEELVKASSRLHEMQQLRDHNRQLNEALASAEPQLSAERAQTEHQASPPELLTEKSESSSSPSDVPQLCMTAANGPDGWRGFAKDSACGLDPHRFGRGFWEPEVPAAASRPVAFSGTKGLPASTSAKLSVPHRTNIVAPVASSASAAPGNAQAKWQRVADAAGQPQPSTADIEKFERCMAVLRSMSLDAGDGVMSCVIVNNGDVAVVVDRLLASVA
jgi:hypothetical protein